MGIRCSDGIVLGADSAATLMSQGMVTAQQRSMKKLAASGRVVTGITGHVGLGQRIRADLEFHLNSDKWTGDRQAVLTQMRRHLWHNIVELEMRAARAALRTLRHDSCTDSARSDTLVATVIEGRHELIHLDDKCSPSLVEDDLPFTTIGVGQQTADPFLAFVRRILWPTGLPSLATGIFSVVWTLSHVIDANPNGIGDPVQLAILSSDGENWVARDVSASEVQEHRSSVAGAEEALKHWAAEFFKMSTDQPAPAPPE